MRYRAICPACGKRLSRRVYFSSPRGALVGRACEHCPATIRVNRIWEWTGSSLLAGFALTLALSAISAGALGFIHWTWASGIVLGAMLAMVAIGWVLFPYVTPFELVAQGPRCAGCGYDLYGTQAAECPECGRRRESLGPR